MRRAAVTAVAALRMIEPDRSAGLRAGADVPGALLITGAMMLGVFTVRPPDRCTRRPGSSA